MGSAIAITFSLVKRLRVRCLVEAVGAHHLVCLIYFLHMYIIICYCNVVRRLQTLAAMTQALTPALESIDQAEVDEFPTGDVSYTEELSTYILILFVSYISIRTSL